MQNWDCGRAIPFLGIFVSNFWYCVFAVYNKVIRMEPTKLFKLPTIKLSSLSVLINTSY
jgi:hypothetical protein